MQQYADIYSLQNYCSSFAVNKYLHTVASVGFLIILFFRISFIIHGAKEILHCNMVKGEDVPVHAMYEYRRSRGTVPHIRNLGRSTSCATRINPVKPLALN